MLARRFRVGGGEIDVIARRGSTVAFVEVKLRAALGDAMIAIAPAKRRRMARAARVFISRQRATGLTWRADADLLGAVALAAARPRGVRARSRLSLSS